MERDQTQSHREGTAARCITLAQERGSTAKTRAGAMRFLASRAVTPLPIPDGADAYGGYSVQRTLLTRCGETIHDALRRLRTLERMEARAAAWCRADGLWTWDDACAEAAASDEPIVAEIVSMLRGVRTYRVSQSSWVGGRHTDVVYIDHSDSGSCDGGNDVVWHRRHAWSGTNSTHTYHITRQALAILGVDRLVIGGLVTLDYDNPDADGVASARWAVQGRGVSIRPEDGYIVRGRYHVRWSGEDTPAARRRAMREYIRSLRARIDARAERRAAAEWKRLDARLSLGEANGYGGVLVTREDSVRAGNCPTGTDSWIESHLPGRAQATVEEVLATGDRGPTVRRAILAAIRRAQGARG